MPRHNADKCVFRLNSEGSPRGDPPRLPVRSTALKTRPLKRHLLVAVLLRDELHSAAAAAAAVCSNCLRPGPTRVCVCLCCSLLSRDQSRSGHRKSACKHHRKLVETRIRCSHGCFPRNDHRANFIFNSTEAPRRRERE